tara:strand:+ start:402 stop:581 length:180 start_codon:yes stop_codon:yes gene_type:complete
MKAYFFVAGLHKIETEVYDCKQFSISGREVEWNATIEVNNEKYISLIEDRHGWEVGKDF